MNDDTVDDDDLVDAYAAIDARQQSPTDALAAATEVMARPGLSPRARLVALWARGVAERELNHLESAEQHLREAVAVGLDIGASRLVADVSSALVVVVSARGRLTEALDLADSIRDAIPPAQRADLDMRRAIVLEHLGRPIDALEAYAVALVEVRSGPDRVLEARLRCNRSVVLAYQGRTEEALADAERAERLAAANEQWFLAGGAAHNHAFAAGLHGDLVTALASFARADDWYGRVGYPGRSAGVLASDRCEVLLAAGLVAEARASAEQAVAALVAVADVVDLAEARLLLARSCLADGDTVAARDEAEAAQAAFEADDRRGWAKTAEFVAFIASRSVQGATDRFDLGAARQTADELAALGWAAEAATVRISAAEIAIRRGDGDFAREQLAIVASARGRGRADRRANAWLAAARLRSFDGDRAGAKRALGAGLRVVAQHQATLGATDLRIGATSHARHLADLGLAMALEDKRPQEILTWAERVRANALAVPAVRPPDDDALASALVGLRRAGTEYDAARRADRSTRVELDAVRRYEATVRDIARIASGHGADSERFSVPELRRRLGPTRQLVEYVESAGVVSAVVVTERGCRLHELGPTGQIAELIDTAVFSLGRLARTGISVPSAAAATALLADAFERLDDLLIVPLHLVAEDIVVVPTGVVHGMPWGGLPSLRDVAFSIATSARRWAPVDPALIDDEQVGVIVGPGLVESDGELAAVTSIRPTAAALTGDAATVDATLALLDRVDVAHLACHGTLRSDSPMFSSLALADGPLTIYDIEGLAAAPTLVVLPACHAGANAVGIGDEVIGTASALLGVGVEVVIAPITVVNDAATGRVMTQLHRHLADGMAPNAALAAVRRWVPQDDAAAGAVAASLLCLE